MKNSLPLITVTQLVVALVANAAESPVRMLDEVVVTGIAGDPVLSQKKALKKVKETPGQASVLTPEDWNVRDHTLADVFESDPSVNAEATGEGNESRISIRGSAAQSGRGNRGMTMLQDGIPSGSVDGMFIGNFVDPVNLQRAQVFPGANGFAHGATQFGGAIDFQLKNGLSHPGGFLKADYGSYESVRASLQYGGIEGAVDYYFGVGHLQGDGYRDNSAWESNYFMGNLGYAWSDDATTRVYFTVLDQKAGITGNLTLAQFADDPRQRQSFVDDSSARTTDSFRVAQRTDWSTADAEYTFYSYFQNLELGSHFETGGRRPMVDDVNLDLEEFGIGARSEHRWELAGMQQLTKASIGYDYGRNILEGTRGPGVVAQEDKAEDFAVYVENQTSLNSKHKVSLGLGWNMVRRKHFDNRPIPAARRDDYAENQDGGFWRVGYIYELDKKSQIFANVSQSFEAVSFGSIDRARAVLDPQKSLTMEVGSRFKRKWLGGSVSAYHAEIDGELVSFVASEMPLRYSFTNEDTVHRGIEVSLDVELLKAFDVRSDYRLKWKAKYQLNDFYFDGGASKGNQMPGISPHVYQSGLKLIAPERKWSTDLSVRYKPEGNLIDNANTRNVPGYATWRLSGDYQVSDNVTLYGGVDNLFDKQYIRRAAINPRGPAFVSPGEGRTAYVGAKVTW